MIREIYVTATYGIYCYFRPFMYRPWYFLLRLRTFCLFCKKSEIIFSSIISKWLYRLWAEYWLLSRSQDRVAMISEMCKVWLISEYLFGKIRSIGLWTMGRKICTVVNHICIVSHYQTNDLFTFWISHCILCVVYKKPNERW